MNPELLLSMFGSPQGDMLAQSAGDVSETGQALKGPGGPFDDMIAAQVEGEDGSVSPARLSPGEFVIRQPAVALLGDGNPEVGAYMLDILQNHEGAITEVRDVLKKYIG